MEFSASLNSDPEKPAAGLPVEVAVALPVYRTYTYLVSADTVIENLVGFRVLVPFGTRRVTGYVLGPSEDMPDGQIKAIDELLDETALFPPAMVQFFRWISSYYMYPLGLVIQTALPGGINVAERASYLLNSEALACLGPADLDPDTAAIVQALENGPRTIKQLERSVRISGLKARIKDLLNQGLVVRRLRLSSARTRPAREKVVALCPGLSLDGLSKARRKLVSILSANGPMSIRSLRELVPTAPSLVRAMDRQGQVEVSYRPVYRDPFGEKVQPDLPPVLTPEQQDAVDCISQAMDRGFKPFVLAGITGSGKTEVYLRLAARALESGKPVIVLVPEIALVSQSERRFRARFGSRVALLHSGLSAGERYDQWLKLAAGKAMIAIGARSAIFAPFNKPGLIIVDEEHDLSYKQDGGLYYNGRDLAMVRGKQSGAVVVLGSATPSVQSVYNVETGKYHRIDLRRRISRQRLPQVEVVNLGDYRGRDKLYRIFSPPLISAVKETLAQGQQAVLFVNRRGSAGNLICRLCGQPVRCRHCDVSLTWHRRQNAYRCHYCGFSQAATSRCTYCGSVKIKRLGLGTEKVESVVKDLFPGARVARMDKDTIGGRKQALISLLKDIRNGNIDILVGTQMVAKGHDYPRITLVGIICADLALSMPDFRAGERTFQLLAQVAGRAGRGSHPGRVILQTYNPDHFTIKAACCQDFEQFYNQEIEQRRVLGYPPFSRLIQIRIFGRDREQTSAAAGELGRRARSLQKSYNEYCGVQVLGPVEAPLARIAGRYRWQLLLKAVSSELLRRFATKLCFDDQGPRVKGRVGISIDVDPMDMM